MMIPESKGFFPFISYTIFKGGFYKMGSEWNGFVGGQWEKVVDVRDFIQRNYTPYEGDDAFLCGPTQATKDLWELAPIPRYMHIPAS